MAQSNFRLRQADRDRPNRFHMSRLTVAQPRTQPGEQHIKWHPVKFASLPFQ